MKSPVANNDREPGGQAARLLERPRRAAREARVARQGRLVELARETSRRLRRPHSARAVQASGLALGGDWSHGSIAIVADTHMPKGPRRLSDHCRELLAQAEAVIHAGDFTGRPALEEIQALCPRLHAVHGNVDEPAIRAELPETLELTLGPRRLGVIHDAGPAKGRLARLRRRFAHTDAVVFGHSHLPVHDEEDGFQIFNPGSPTERRRAPHRSLGLLRIEDGALCFQHVWLDAD